ncbi:MAG TPA: hypothetical protein VK540_12945 [Polyangiaceae bacterium]|nr:hypothetical protein [Polyangiaceae bacterium]
MRKLVIGVLAGAVVFGPSGCGNDAPPPGGEQTGQSCTSAAQCFPDTYDAALRGGPAVCIDRVPGGYCTHICTTDADCCAVPGECRTGYPQVCSPFESMKNPMYCFLSCEDIPDDAGFPDADGFCGAYAYQGFRCRSSGGGPANRKVCVP